MNKFLVINVKQCIAVFLGIAVLLTICFAGNSLVNNVIETMSNNRLLPIYSVETPDKKVALTFDCAWRSR